MRRKKKTKEQNYTIASEKNKCVIGEKMKREAKEENSKETK